MAFVAPSMRPPNEASLIRRVTQKQEKDVLPEADQYEADHRNFRLGDDKDKESFVKKYGVDAAIDVLDKEIEDMGVYRGGNTGGSQHLKELELWRQRLELRRTPETENDAVS